MPSIQRPVSSPLALVSSVTFTINRRDSSSNTLELSGDTGVQHKLKFITDVLTLDQQIQKNNIEKIHLIQEFLVFGTISTTGSVLIDVDTQLNLTDKIHVSLTVTSIQDILNFQHFVSATKPIFASVTSELSGSFEALDPEEVIDTDPFDTLAVSALVTGIGLRQSVSSTNTFNLAITSYLSLSHVAGQGPSEVVSNHIHLSHQIDIFLHEEVISKLQLQHSVTVDSVEWVEHTLVLTGLAEADGIYPLSVVDVLNLRNVVSYYTIDFCNYNPGIGAGVFDYVAPTVISPVLVHRKTTIFTWESLTLEIRNPVFDNVDQYEFRRINRRTRGGTLDLFRDETWPKVKRLIMSFTQLKHIERHDLLQFLQKSIGQEIGLLDFESRQWAGIILTPSTLVSQPTKTGNNVSLEFEGELV